MSVNLLVPFGFYGWGNVGDESTLQGFSRLVARDRKRVRVWVASRNPDHTARVEPSFKYFNAVGRDIRRRFARLLSIGQVVAGGTPIMDVLGEWPLSELAPLVSDAYRKQKPMIFVGTGTEALTKEKSRAIMAKEIVPKVLHWSVRCTRDKERLVDYGVVQERVTVAADMAWLLEKVSTEFGKEYLKQLNIDTDASLVGVNVNNEKFVLEREPRLFEKLGGFLDLVVEKYGVNILFFCNEVREGESFDKVASQKVQAHMKKRDKTILMPNHYWAPQEMLSLLGCCRMTFGMRYHFCLFSALQNVPFIALKRSGKVEDLCWDMNWPYGVSLNEIDVVKLSDMYEDIEQNRDHIIKSLPVKVAALRERALMNSASLDALFRSLGK
jgi:polysaccharide pyruvyl transferase WcaK-like protein